jgi:tRNA threonylcarbamoyladenosine biosynthesis protein TsaB
MAESSARYAGALMLAWDTCTGDGAVAIGRGTEPAAETRFRTVKGHASWLMPLVDSTVTGHGHEPADIEALAVGIGPGGFTGVKVGVATAKALALALDVTLVGVPTLDLLAAHAPGDAGPVLACMDARQGLVYAAGYSEAGARPRRSTEYLCVTPAEAGEATAALGDEVAVVGIMPEELREAAADAGASATLARVPEPGFPSGRVLLVVARAMLEDGLGGDAFSVVPLYLKKPV